MERKTTGEGVSKIMGGTYNYDTPKMLGKAILQDDLMGKYDEFLNKYKDKSDRELFEEISRVQSKLSPEVKRQHIRNLEYLSQMGGFVDEEVKKRINFAKRLIVIDDATEKTDSSMDVSTAQFFGGSSLLLFFLLLTTLFRGRRYYYGPYRRPFRGPFTRPY